VLVATGIWHIAATPAQVSRAAGYRTTLIVKSGLSALAALFLGVLLAG
jgi:hypothetical protein